METPECICKRIDIQEKKVLCQNLEIMPQHGTRSSRNEMLARAFRQLPRLSSFEASFYGLDTRSTFETLEISKMSCFERGHVSSQSNR
jgi:hypothetical protein